MTQAALATDTIVVESAQSATPSYDPRDYEIRWGINAVLREKQLNPRECGFAYVPFARFIPIVSFSTPREVHSIDWTMDKERPHTVPAVEAERFMREALAGEGIQENINWGFQTGFIGDKDVSLYAVLSAILLPRLSKIRQACLALGVPSPISQVCEGTEELDFEPRESCPTCWSKWVNSEACVAYGQAVELSGMRTVEQDRVTGETIERIVKPSIEQFEAARLMVRKALSIGTRTLQAQWGSIASEMERPDNSGRKDMLEFEHAYRKDLHEPRPQDRQVAALDRAMNRVANVAEGRSSDGSGGNDDLLRALVSSQIASNKAISSIQQKLEVLLPDEAPAPPAAPSVPDMVRDDDSTLAPGASEMLAQPQED